MEKYQLSTLGGVPTDDVELTKLSTDKWDKASITMVIIINFKKVFN